MLQLLSRFLDLKRTVFQLVAGHFKESPFNEVLLAEGRAVLSSHLHFKPGEEPGACPEHQRIFLTLQAALARECLDPDWSILAGPGRSFSAGVPLGYHERLPRTPAVFSHKRRWRKYDEVADPKEHQANYRSAVDVLPQLEAQLEEER